MTEPGARGLAFLVLLFLLALAGSVAALVAMVRSGRSVPAPWEWGPRRRR